MSPSQYRAYLQYLNAHHFTRAQRAAFDAKKRAKARRRAAQRRAVAKARRKAGAGAPAVPGQWITGGNGEHETCAATAVANSLLAATGVRASEGDVLALHEAAGGDADGASLASVLAAAARCGLAGVRPVRCQALPGGGCRPGCLAELELAEGHRGQAVWDVADPGAPEWGVHAALLLAPWTAVTWGGLVLVTPWFAQAHIAAGWRVWWPEGGDRAGAS
jgi:hypothetical protein